MVVFVHLLPQWCSWSHDDPSLADEAKVTTHLRFRSQESGFSLLSCFAESLDTEG